MNNNTTKKQEQHNDRTVTIMGHEIKERSCLCYKARIMSKDFQNLMLCSAYAFFEKPKKDKHDMTESKDHGISLTQDKIIKWMDQAISTEVFTNDEELVLKIETEHYWIYVVLEEGRK